MNIRLENVSVASPDGLGQERLREISHVFEMGRITLVLGSTGAGKSTLLDVLAGLRPADAGSVWLEDGNGLQEKGDPGTLARWTSLAGQSPDQQLFARTVASELAYTLRPFRLNGPERERRISEALEAAGLSPDWLPKNPLTMSYGQKRRVALASAFAPGSRWLLLDEPTAGLDPAARRELTDALENWRWRTRGGIVIATHDLSGLFGVADNLAVLRAGRLVAKGTPAEVCERSGILEEAGAGLPEEVALTRLMRRRGIFLPCTVPPDRWAADVLEAKGLSGAFAAKGRTPDWDGHAALCAPPGKLDGPEGPEESEGLEGPEGPEGLEGRVSPDGQAPSFVLQLDPRAKWLFYLQMSAVSLFQGSWQGALAGSLVTGLLTAIVRIPPRVLWRTLKPMATFSAAAVFFAGLRMGGGLGVVAGVGFSPGHALTAARQLLQVTAALADARILVWVATPGELRRGLEDALAGLRVGRRFAEALALAMGLVVSMGPVVRRDWERFSRIVRARGKSPGKPGRIPARDLPALLIPILLSLLQKAENLAMTMESRGYREIGQRASRRRAPRAMQGRDLAAVALGSLWLILSLALSRL